MELIYFYRADCPYCRQAKRLIAELEEEHPELRGLVTRSVEETQQPGLAEQYDYWYVPTLFLGEEKLYEANPSETAGEMKQKLESALEKALAAK